MKKTRYREALKELGLTPRQAGELFGFKRAQAARFASGEAPIPALVGKIVELLLAKKLTMEDLR